MSSATVQLRAHLRHRGVIFWSYFVPVMFYVPFVTVAAVRDRTDSAISLFALLAFAAATAFFLASAQQEVFNRATFYLLPALPRGMVTNQIRFGLGVGVAALVAAHLVPGLPELVTGAPGRAVSIACLAVLVYAIVMQLALQFSHLAFVVFQVMWLQIFLIRPVSRIEAEQLIRILDQTSLWLAGAGLAAFLVLQQVRSRALHRRIAERPYLSIADVKNADKVAEFKRLRSLHKTEAAGGPPPFARAMQAGLRRVAQLRREGRNGWALALEAYLLAICGGMPRRWWQLGLWAVVLPGFMVMGGYFDARNAVVGTNLVAWFVGLPFMAIVWFAQVGHYLRHPAPGRLWDRGTRRRALGPALVLMAGSGVIATALLYGFGHAAAAVLPPVAWHGEDLRMVAPRADVFGMILFTLPVQMLVIALWRSPRCLKVGQQIGTLVFFVYHAVVRFVAPAEGLPVLFGIGAGALLLLPFVWGWRVGRTDQP